MASLFLVFVFGTLLAQPRILHFTATSGFDHGTRAVSFAMFESIGIEIGVQVDDAPTATPFSDPGTLEQYDVIVFSNTSGNAILDATQRTNFENWVANGGHVLGIHAASDTYRHSTANGSSTGTWDYYAELIGASVQVSPNHVSGTPLYALSHIGLHPSTANLPDPWLKNEEYYYWEGGYYGPDNTEVLRVEQTVGPNGQVNSYDAARPMSWYRELPNGTRVFYTALGHATSNYTSDDFFRAHLRDALVWLINITTGTQEFAPVPSVTGNPNPTNGSLIFRSSTSTLGNSRVQISNAMGQVVFSGWLDAQGTFDAAQLASGSYAAQFLTVSGSAIFVFRFYRL